MMRERAHGNSNNTINQAVALQANHRMNGFAAENYSWQAHITPFKVTRQFSGRGSGKWSGNSS